MNASALRDQMVAGVTATRRRGRSESDAGAAAAADASQVDVLMRQVLGAKTTAHAVSGGASAFAAGTPAPPPQPTTSTSTTTSTLISNATTAAILQIRTIPISPYIASVIKKPVTEIPQLNTAHVFCPETLVQMLSLSPWWAFKADEQYDDVHALYVGESAASRSCMLLSKELHLFPIAGENPLVVMRIESAREKRTVNQVVYSARPHRGDMAPPVYSPYLMRVTAPTENAQQIRDIVAKFAELSDDPASPLVTIEELKRDRRDASVAFEVMATKDSMEVFEVLRHIAFVTHHAPLLTSQFKALQATFRIERNTVEKQTIYKESVELFIALAQRFGADATLRHRQLRVTVQDRTHLAEFVKFAKALEMFHLYDVPAIYAGHQSVRRADNGPKEKPRYAIKSLGPQPISSYRALAQVLGVKLDESRVSSKFMPIEVPDDFVVPRVDQAQFPGMVIGLLNEHTYAKQAAVTAVPLPAGWAKASSPAPPKRTVFSPSADGASRPPTAQLGGPAAVPQQAPAANAADAAGTPAPTGVAGAATAATPAPPAASTASPPGQAAAATAHAPRNGSQPAPGPAVASSKPSSEAQADGAAATRPTTH